MILEDVIEEADYGFVVICGGRVELQNRLARKWFPGTEFWLELLKDKSSWPRELKCVAPTPQWIELQHTKSKSGSDIEWDSIRAYDITETKLREIDSAKTNERLQLALQNSGEGIWDWNLVTNELYYSPHWYTNLGYDPYEMPDTLATWEELLHPADVKPTWEALERHFRGETEKYEHINRLKKKDGTFRWNLDFGCVVEWDEAGKPLRMVGIDRDITELKKLEAELNQRQKMESIGLLAGGIAHDFNNILAPIIIYNDLLLNALKSKPALTEWLNESNLAANQARQLVQKILRYSRQSEEELRPVCMQEALDETLTLVSRGVRPGITITHQCDEEDDMHCMGDPTTIHQVIMNLCNNACQAIEETGTVEVTLSLIPSHGVKPELQRHFGKRDLVHLEVVDDGAGINIEDVNRVFDPYFTTKSKDEGTGLGLSIVYQIVRGMGGLIAISRNEDIGEKGTTVSVKFPRVRDEATLPPPPYIQPLNHQVKALVIDDDVRVLRALRTGLQLAGVEVVAFTDPNVALEYFRNQKEEIDIVCSDLSMELMTGDELLMKIKKLDSSVPTVIFSGFGQSKVRFEGVIDAWVNKPLRVVEFLTVVHELVPEPRSARTPLHPEG